MKSQGDIFRCLYTERSEEQLTREMDRRKGTFKCALEGLRPADLFRIRVKQSANPIQDKGQERILREERTPERGAP